MSFPVMGLVSKSDNGDKSNNVGLILAGAFGAAAVGLMALSSPFVLPAFRKHCLPYVPATEEQLKNLTLAFRKHSKNGDKFLDIGSGDGRICRLAANLEIYAQVHGVELNSLLVYYSRLTSLARPSQSISAKYFHRDLWKFPLHNYESVCIFGVESMMDPLCDYIKRTNQKRQFLFACRFPFKGLKQIDEIGKGIDTVWVYEIAKRESSEQF